MGDVVRGEFRDWRETGGPPAGGDGDGTDARLARLEVEVRYIRRDLDALREGQDEVLRQLDTLNQALLLRPTARQFWGLVAVLAALALSVVHRATPGARRRSARPHRRHGRHDRPPLPGQCLRASRGVAHRGKRG